MSYYDELVKNAPAPGLTVERGFYNRMLTDADPTLPIDDPSNVHGDDPAPLGAAFLSGFVEDPKKKIELFARSRFPKLPLEEAVKRYGIVGDNIVYIDDDGRIQKELSGVNKVARAVGEYGLPFAGAAVGVAAGPVGSAIGGAGGMGWRKNIGTMLGDTQDPWQNTKDMAIEGAVDLAGAKAGQLFADKFVNRSVARDISHFDPTDAQKIIDLGRQYGITVTPAEATRLGSLVSQQTRLGMGFDEAGDIVREFYRKRAAQEGVAIEQFIGRGPSSSETGANAKQAALDAIEAAKESRRRAASPLYKRWVRNDVLVDEQRFNDLLSDPDSGPLLKEYIRRVKADKALGVSEHNDRALSVIQEVQAELRDEARYLKTQMGRKNRPFKMDEARKKLLKLVDEQYPEYATARRAYAGESPRVSRLEKGIEGTLSRVKDDKLHTVAKRIFSQDEAGPETVRRARLMFSVKGKQQEWDDLVNTWLRYNWEKQRITSDAYNISRAGNWKAAVYGSENARTMMKEALGPQRFGQFEELMEVLEATARVPKGQSMTEPAQQAARAEASAAAPFATKMEGFGFRGVRNWWIDKRVDKWRTELAKVITNQNAMDTIGQLRALKSINPSDPGVYELAFLALSQAGVEGLEGAVEGYQPDQLPPVMNR